MYRFYDEAGNKAVVSARGGRVLALEKAEKPLAKSNGPSAFWSLVRLAAALSPGGGALYLGFSGMLAWPWAVGVVGLGALALYAVSALIADMIEPSGQGILHSLTRRWARPIAFTGILMLAGLGVWYLAGL